MYSLVVSFLVKPDKREQFLAAAEDDSICSVRDEPGCFRFDVLQATGDENRYSFYEVYRDEAAFQAHTQTPHLARWRAAAAECLVEGTTTRSVSNVLFPRDYR